MSNKKTAKKEYSKPKLESKKISYFTGAACAKCYQGPIAIPQCLAQYVS